MTNNNNGFSLVEVLVVVGIIALIASIAIVSLTGSRDKARDAKRMSDLNQIGRFLTFGCPVPAAGAGEYDLTDVLNQYKASNPQYASQIPAGIKDPKTGTDAVSNYKYLVEGANRCVLYANLENPAEPVTLAAITAPAPGGGKGVFEAPVAGWNGGRKYFQVSN